MEKNIQSYAIIFALVLGFLSLASGEQYEDVKAGRYQNPASQPTNETGLCYTRLP